MVFPLCSLPKSQIALWFQVRTQLGFFHRRQIVSLEEHELEQKNSSLASSSGQQRSLHEEKHDRSKDDTSLSSSSDQQHKEKHDESKDSFSSWSPSEPCRRFSLAEIKWATLDFDDALVIGKGGFGNVYKGRIEFGEERIDVAVKRLNLDSNQGATEFRAEIEMLSQFRHSHIVSLLGYHYHEHEGSDKREMMLVYEYMSNGSLEDHLHKRRSNVLTWVQRLRICIGAARGLDYLHTGTSVQTRVIHRDVKSSNILLDENFAAKISDFGLSRIGPANQAGTTKVYTDLIKGTFGYMDAEYFATHRLTRKSDVYAFGVVLLEVLCGRPALDFTLDEEQQSLSVWARDCIREGNVDRIIDPSLRGQTTAKCLNKFGQIAYECILTSSKDRPTMTKVAARLESVLALSQKHGGVTIAEKVRALFSTKVTEKDSEITKKDSGPAIFSQLMVPRPGIFSQLITAKELAFLKNHDVDSSLQIIGKGEYGEVYKYDLPEGKVKTIAIKKIIHPSKHATELAEEDTYFLNEKMRQIKSEIQTVGQINHRNLLPLLAHVTQPNCNYLIYEFMKNGSLQDILQQVKEGSRELDWLARHKVALGVAAGLEYLHMSIIPKIVHRDLKPANILLDDDMKARIADFGLAKWIPDEDTCSIFVGTLGYIAPEYYQTMKLSEKCDIYSFGVVLAVLVIGKLPSDEFFQRTSEMSLVKWMRNVMTSEDPKQAIDPKLMGNGYEEQMLLVLKIACFCTLNNPKERPNSKESRLMLAQINH